MIIIQHLLNKKLHKHKKPPESTLIQDTPESTQINGTAQTPEIIFLTINGVSMPVRVYETEEV